MGQTLKKPRSTVDVGTSTDDLQYFVNKNAPASQYQDLPTEVHDLIRQFQNCGEFFKQLQPITPSQIDANPPLRRALRDVVIHSLNMFLARVNKFMVFKFAGIKYGSKREMDPEFNSMPLCYRVYLAVEAVQNDPNMPAAELLERCKRIVGWKEELRQMPAAFARLLQAYTDFLERGRFVVPFLFRDAVAPLRDVWDATGLELANFEDHLMWGSTGWYEGSLEIDEVDTVVEDAEKIVGFVGNGIAHDNAILKDVLKRL